MLERITIDPAVMSGKPCIRGLRVTVGNVLRLLAAGYPRERILAAYPYLEAQDLDACCQYAALRVADEELTAVLARKRPRRGRARSPLRAATSVSCTATTARNGVRALPRSVFVVCGAARRGMAFGLKSRRTSTPT